MQPVRYSSRHRLTVAIKRLRIPGLRGVSPMRIVHGALCRFAEQDMLTYAAALTYYAVFSIFPLSLFLVSLFSYFDLSTLLEWLRQQAQGYFLPDTMQQINQALGQLQARRYDLISLSALVALWTCSRTFRAARKALNAIYGLEKRKPSWKTFPVSMACTVAVAAMLLLAAVIFLVGPPALAWLVRAQGMDAAWVALWRAWLRWPLILLLLTAAVAVVYGAAPDVSQRFRFITPGAFVAVLSWVLVSIAFRFAVRHFVNYNLTYGSLGTLVLLLVYVHLSSMVLLFGAELNAQIDRHAPEKRP